jgi:uncharacterized membrane protein YraQ (UPF0718 family)
MTKNLKILIYIGLGISLWIFIYRMLQTAVDFLIDSVFHMASGEHLTEALRFFIFEVPKVMMLLMLIVFFVGILRSFFSPEKTRKALEGKPLFLGNIMASLLGIVTPFCSCSAIPLFLGFVEAGIPLGITFSFLIAAPMINEVAVVLLFGLFGWKVALIYVGTGLLLAISAGWIIGKINPVKWVEPWVYEVKAGAQFEGNGEGKLYNRVMAGIDAVKEIVGKVWLYVIIGIGVGAGAHGYVPDNYMASVMQASNWYSVPLSVLIGIPLYSNAAGIIPIISVLIEKGAPLGTALAFMMSVIGLSLPEMIILRKVLKIKFILTFVGIVAIGILAVGYIFNHVVFI